MKRVDWLSAAMVAACVFVFTVALLVDPPLNRVLAFAVLAAVVPVGLWLVRDTRRANRDIKSLKSSPWSPK